MKKHITQRAVACLLVVLALAFTAGATSAFVGAKPFYLDAPLRFDYVPSGAGDKPILATDLDGNYVKAVAHSNQAITVTLQDGQNAQHTLSIPVGATLTGATYAADTETLTLTLSGGDPVTADLSGLTTSAEVATAISAAIAAETDAVLTGASYAAGTENLTLNLSEGSPVTADLSGLTTAAELASAINTALDGVSGVTVTGASYAAGTELLTLTLSEGEPVTADLSGLTTSAEVATAISTALAAETDAVLTGATYAADSETLTLTLSEGSPVTADLSGLTTAAELASAINTALDGVSGVTVTGASYAAGTELLTLTLSEGEPVTADLSGLTTSAEVATAISTALAAETDAVLTGATYAADSETLTLTLSEGSPVTGDLSGLTTAAELATAINTALDGVSGVTVTGASYAAGTELLTLTLSEGEPVTADLSGLTTGAEVATAISAALAAETDAVLTGATYAAGTENLTLTLSAGSPVTADLSGLTTAAELATAINTALDGVSGVTVTGASYAAGTELLTLTLSEGGPVTADLSDLSTDAQLDTAFANGTALPQLLGSKKSRGSACTRFAPTDIIIPQSGWITVMIELRSNNGQHIHHYSMPVSLLHNLPVKVNDTAGSATVVHTSETANALTLPVRGSGELYYIGLTTANRLVARASNLYWPCALTVYTGPAVVAQSTATVTGASFSSTNQVLTLTLSEGGSVTADLSGLTTSAEVATAISTAIAAETDAVLTDATYAADSENLTLTLSAGGPVTADLSGLTTAAELATAINTALDGVSGVTVTGASYAAGTELLTLTLSEGGPVTADLSGLSTDAQLDTAFANGTALPQLLGSKKSRGSACTRFAPTDIIIPQSGWIAVMIELRSNNGQHIHHYSMPVSLLHNLPVKVNDTAGSATVVHTSETANALTLPVRGSGELYYIGLTTANRLVARASNLYWPCALTVYTGPAVVAQSTATVTGASFSSTNQVLTLTLSEGGSVTADLSGLTTSAEVATAISTAIAAETDAVLTDATYAADSENLTLTLSAGGPVTGDLSGLTTAAELASAINTALDGVSGVAVTGASYAAGTELLTLTLSEGEPVTADLSGLSTDTELVMAVTAALNVANELINETLANQTDAVLTGASYAADSETLTLTLSEGGPVTADLSGLTTDAELTQRFVANTPGVLLAAYNIANTAVATAIAAETDAVISNGSYAGDTQTLTFTLSEGGPIDINLTDVATDAELRNAIDAIPAGGVTSASFANDTETLTLTLADATTVTVDLSIYSTGPEVSTAITTALAAETDAVVTNATYSAETESLTLTVSEGEAITADLSSLSTDAALTAAIANATQRPRLLGSTQNTGADCQSFTPKNIVIPQTGWVTFVIELRSDTGQYIHNQSMPVSLLHNLPVKIDDTATSATVNNSTTAANALSLPVRAVSDGYHVGLTTANRLVTKASHAFSPCRLSVYTGPTLTTQNTTVAYDANTRILTMTHGDTSVSTINLADHPDVTDTTTVIWGLSPDANVTIGELSDVSSQASTASLLFRAADFNGSAKHLAFALRSPSTVSSLTSTVGGTNLCNSGFWSPCTHDAQIIINNRIWDVYATSSPLTLPVDAVGLLTWE